MAIQDIRRAKALAVVLESATVVDADGNPVDLKALDEEMNRLQAMEAMQQGMTQVEVDEEVDVYTDEDGNVVEVDVTEEIIETQT